MPDMSGEMMRAAEKTVVIIDKKNVRRNISYMQSDWKAHDLLVVGR